MADRRRTFGPVVLLGLGGGTLMAVASNERVVVGKGASASAFGSLSSSLDAEMPLVTALGLVVLACWGVALVTRGQVRRAAAALSTVAAAGALAAALAAYTQVADRVSEELAQVGIEDASLSHTGWYWAAVVGAVLALVAGVLAVAWAPAWPEMGSRYDAPGSGAAPVAAPEEQSSLDLWKAMDEGRDPTA
jgi:uncharacterized membrane protein (TIGR02234 family)